MVLRRRPARSAAGLLAALLLAPPLLGAVLVGCAGHGGETISSDEGTTNTDHTRQDESDLENEIRREEGRPVP